MNTAVLLHLPIKARSSKVLVRVVLENARITISIVSAVRVVFSFDARVYFAVWIENIVLIFKVLEPTIAVVWQLFI